MAEAPLVLTVRDANRATLARQMLLGRVATKPLVAIEKLAGLQAQWAKPPHVGLWSRLETFEREQLLALLRKRDVVRATMMRGTIHVVSAKDYLAFRPLFQPMLSRAVLSVLRQRAKGIDVDAVVAHARKILARGPKTFEEVREALAATYPKADARAMGFIARLNIQLVLVPTDDDRWGFPTNPAFAIGESWLGAKRAAAGSLEDLALRYLAAFGPATPRDAQLWSGMPGMKEAFEALRPKLVVFHDERKRELFDLPKAPRPDGNSDVPVRFLPEFDSVLLAHVDRKRFVPEAHKKKVFPGGLRVAQTVLVDGFTAGTWTVTRSKSGKSGSGAVLTVSMFEPAPKKTRDALAAEGERLLRFVEPEATKLEVAVR
jgi:Winged helix DNA-binding domain